MASVFSSPAASSHDFSEHNDQLIQSSRAHHGFLSSHHILNASVMVGLIRSLITTIVGPLIRNAPHPYGTSANDADRSTRKPRRFLWHPPAS